MAGITLEIAESRLAAYLAAEEALLTGHASVQIGDKRFQRSELAQIQAGIQLWQSRVNALSTSSAGGCRITYGVPR